MCLVDERFELLQHLLKLFVVYSKNELPRTRWWRRWRIPWRTRWSRRQRSRDDGPKNIIPLGFYDYPCQEDLVAKVEVENVPFFNAPIYIEGEKQIGKVDEIFGHLRDFYVSIKLMDNMKPDGFQPKQKLFIDSAKLLPLARFLPGNQTRKPAGRVGKPGGRGGGGRGGPGGGFRGNRGGGGGGGGGKRW
ncbi:hypothetical protein pipiens_002590 [Culex pipiens pipiens]|uniref:H/ACA ribonucleoprotein complex subunit n=1 Tax=Culex pipiens pipiens TaxID=38569 RepID=A0ABD1DBP2_CULPP